MSDGEADRTRTVPVKVLEPTTRRRASGCSCSRRRPGFRHGSIDEGHAAIEQLGDEHAFQVDHTEDATAFRDAVLGHYDAVVFLSTTGDVLNDTQQRAFERYIQAGGGYTGIHAAADTEYDWNWYGHLVGALLPQPPARDARAATVDRRGPDDHTTQGLPAPLEPDRRVVQLPLARLRTRRPATATTARAAAASTSLLRWTSRRTRRATATTVDDDHPISWCQRYDGGRSWYTGMGHTAESFAEADYLSHILGGIEVSAGAAGSDECGVPDPATPADRRGAATRARQAPLMVRSLIGSTRRQTPLAQRYPWDFGDGGTRCARTRTTRTSSRAPTWRRSR